MGLPQIEIASAKIENENAFINEMYLIKGFDRVSLGFWYGPANRVGSGLGVASILIILFLLHL